MRTHAWYITLQWLSFVRVSITAPNRVHTLLLGARQAKFEGFFHGTTSKIEANLLREQSLYQETVNGFSSQEKSPFRLNPFFMKGSLQVKRQGCVL